MEAMSPEDTPEKDVPLRYDIRLLGRILSDTVRAQEGDRVFELVERIRRLVADPVLREAVFGRLCHEWLARSIRNRFPYIDPLNHLQIELLKRHRAGDPDSGVVQGVLLSINGIAAGLRNSR
jgi:phosphoenolpyruvate carboxylase